MIVVVGTPAWQQSEPPRPAGRACAIAIAAAGHGSRVELVGRTGDDDAGDALLHALTQAGVGHVAVLRDPARRTPVMFAAGDGDDAPVVTGDTEPPPDVPFGSDVRPDADDIRLGLAYLTAFDVLVVDDMPPAVLGAAVDAALFAGAAIVVVVPPDAPAPDGLPESATVLASPESDVDGSFGILVGAYAAELDRGRAPRDAFVRAAEDGGAVSRGTGN